MNPAKFDNQETITSLWTEKVLRTAVRIPKYVLKSFRKSLSSEKDMKSNKRSRKGRSTTESTFLKNNSPTVSLTGNFIIKEGLPLQSRTWFVTPTALKTSRPWGKEKLSSRCSKARRKRSRLPRLTPAIRPRKNRLIERGLSKKITSSCPSSRTWSQRSSPWLRSRKIRRDFQMEIILI